MNVVKNGKLLNRLELKLQKDIETLMTDCEVKFSVFLPVLRNDLPEDKSSNDYKNKHKAEYLKQLRASYSVEEIQKMLGVLGYKIRLSLNNQEIEPVKYGLNDIKVKYTEQMAVCELLGINVEWVKGSIEQFKNDTVET